MYNENDNNNYPDGGNTEPVQNTDSDINYTEGAYTEGTYTESRRTANNESHNRYDGLRFSSGADAGQEVGPDRSYIPEEPGRSPERKKPSLAKRAAGIAAAGILFGCVAGGAMVSVNAVGSRMTQNTAVPSAESTLASLDVAPTTAAAVIPVSMGNDVSAIVDKAMPSVVAVTNTMLYKQEDWFFGKQEYEIPSSGSGIIAGQNDEELLIITNNHVVMDADQLSVAFIDNTSVSAAVKGTDSDSDLAVIAVKLSDIPEETRNQIKPAAMGDSGALKLGQGVVAIGNALGQGQSVTVGYVSALDKKVEIDGIERTLLQVDAAINPGNSGGALLNTEGELIGINAAKYADTEVEGIGYAIPISFAKDIIEDLMSRTTKVEVAADQQGYLGIQLQNIDTQMSQSYGMPQGIYVYKIVEGGAAANSDLRERDIITRFDGETVKNGEDLLKLMTYYKGGSTVMLTVQSLENGAYIERQVEVTLGYKKDSPSAENNADGQNEQDRQNEQKGFNQLRPKSGGQSQNN